MISLSAEATSVLAGSGFIYRCNVESWRNGVLLASNVPINSGGEEYDRTLAIPERVVLEVPRVVDGVDWTPTSELSPLAAKGQRLHVKLGVGTRQGQTEWITRARLLIYETIPDGDVLRVTAVGLLELLSEARLISPFQPTGTFVSTLRALIEPALTVLVGAALVDRSVPATINYDEDRLGAVNELLDAWPAEGVVDPEGFLSIAPPDTSVVADFALTDGVGGTVIRAEGASSRADGQNAFVARGQDSTGAQVQGVAYLNTGPNAYGGPYNPLPVPYFFQSPLLTSVGEAQAAAETIRNRRLRETAAQYTVSCVPNPAVQAGDVAALTSDRLGLAAVPCVVESMSLPYAAESGNMPDMTLTVRRLT